MKSPIVGIIMGSDSDLPVMQSAADFLTNLNIEFETQIVSAHRTPDFMFDYAHNAQNRGLKIIIAGAGGSAHLPGMVASLTSLPVIGVPVTTKSLQGLDSLLSIVQMPPGIPVATVAINNSQNAAILAAKILALNDSKIGTKLAKFQQQMNKTVRQKNSLLQKINPQKYIKKFLTKN